MSAARNTKSTDAKAPDGELERAVDSVHLAIDKAQLRLAQGRYTEAEKIAQAGLKLASHLPAVLAQADMIESLVGVLVEARVAMRDPDHRGEVHVESRDSVPSRSSDATRRTSYSAKQVDRGFRTRRVTDDLIAQTGEDPRIIQNTVQYSPDWPDRATKRKRADKDVLFKGPAFEGQDGQVKQTIIYDVRSLMFPLSLTRGVPIMDLRAVTQDAADRAALMYGGDIFAGCGREPAPVADLGTHFDPSTSWPPAPDDGDDQQYRELIRLVNAVIDQN